ncbi:MAG: hypothetical protein LUG99_06985 [Lachnospiraceae bacterium]|nr:hypothetical protein [Lachnospiraceae bacterium]
MTVTEGNTFIETMEEIGDLWSIDQVMDVYADYTLQDALGDRMESISRFTDMIGTILNRR